MLADIEYITGKKFKFPFLAKLQGGSKGRLYQEKEQEKRKEKGKEEKAKLVKDRKLSEVDEYLLMMDTEQVVGVIHDEKAGMPQKGRSASGRRGNWI